MTVVVDTSVLMALLAAETAGADSVATFDGRLASVAVRRGLLARTGE